MTPDLPPVLPGHITVKGPLKHTTSVFDLHNIQTWNYEFEQWEPGGIGSGKAYYAVREGSDLARANGIGGEEPIDIEDGKFYQNRKGEIVGPITPNTEEWKGTHPWTDANRTKYRNNGTTALYADERTEYDLISESPKPEERSLAERYQSGWDDIPPVLDAVDIVSSLESDLAAARAIFPKICDALGNGACCTKDASIEFLSLIPEEVRLVIEKKDREVKRLRAALEAEVSNCPVCAGQGSTADSLDHLLGNAKPDERIECTRCKSSRAALSPASSGKGEGNLHSEAESYRQTAKEVTRRAKACYLNGVANGIDYALGLIPSPLNGEGDA